VVASLHVGCIACLLYRRAALACFIALQPYGHLLFALFRVHLQALRAASYCVAFSALAAACMSLSLTPHHMLHSVWVEEVRQSAANIHLQTAGAMLAFGRIDDMSWVCAYAAADCHAVTLSLAA
jgi:hypothetical protein